MPTNMARDCDLFIDAGNTRIKWATITANEIRWSNAGAVLTTDVLGKAASLDQGALGQTPPHGARPIEPLMALCAALQPQHVVVSNVAGAAVDAAIALSVGPLRVIRVRSVAAGCGVVNTYTNPNELGSDRFAALVATHNTAALAGFAKIIVMAGTAVTIDALSKDGEFLGGAIMPGLALMQGALNRGTAQLPDVGAARLSAAAITGDGERFGQSTHDAILSGTQDALVGAVLQSLARLRRRTDGPLMIVLSGGAAAVIEPLLQRALHPTQMVTSITMTPDLVLDGLRCIHAISL